MISISERGVPPMVSDDVSASVRWPSSESPMSGTTMGRRPKASIQSLIASMSPGVSMAEASTLTCLGRLPTHWLSGTSVSISDSMANA